MTNANLAIRLLLISAALCAPVTLAQAQGDERCVGAKDGQDLATTAIDVVFAKRDMFLAAVRDYGARSGLRVGGVDDGKGWVVVLLESRPYGVSIEVEAMDPNHFRAIARTCNATQDWRPYWDGFEKFVNAHRSDWI